ncbi:putative pectinesterase/pectinesterase inhibitor 54 [Vitis vinifera]|uniref:Pectinesterase n=1 Tax=Vitis vinifera TaxID=29760 RepID=A0A438CZP3_VITVI|nr:putative pectinesterase/pectinesterase inhibitor 54 [Vitis vinifera]
MGKIVGWTRLWLLGFALAGASMSWAAMDDAYEKRVQSECGFTTYPKLCVQTLLGLGHSKVDIPFVLVNKILSETRLPTSNIAKFSYQLATPEAHSAHLVRDSCDMLMSMSLKQLNQSLLALKESARKNKHDIQTWLSAALTFQQTCKDLAVEMTRYFGTSMVQISSKMDHLSQLTNNALAVINRITPGPKKTTSGRGLSEEQVFPSWAATGKRFVIYVKSGVYKEKIHTNKDGITLIGDGKYSTRIVGDDSVGGGASLLSTATFTITGDGFIAKDIGFENAAGPKGEQAVALMVSSDHSVLYKCSIAGYQDTLYAQALRQFYRECDIYGTIDFIFGNAAAVFQNCYLILRRPLGDSFNVILANGRPWKEYSRAVVMESSIDDAIEGRGWIEWPGYGSSVLKSLYFAEYSNIGRGAATSRRVQWPGFHLIGTEEATKFTVANFIAGTSWLPSTGVIFISGLQ